MGQIVARLNRIPRGDSSPFSPRAMVFTMLLRTMLSLSSSQALFFLARNRRESGESADVKNNGSARRSKRPIMVNLSKRPMEVRRACQYGILDHGKLIPANIGMGIKYLTVGDLLPFILPHTTEEVLKLWDRPPNAVMRGRFISARWAVL